MTSSTGSSADPSPTDLIVTDAPVRRSAVRRRMFESDSAEPDLDRVRRIGARFLGLGFIGYPVVSVSAIISSASLTAPWWPPLSVLLSVGPGILLVAASFRPGTGWLSPLATATSAGYLLGVALWFPAWDGTTISTASDSAQWMIAFCGMPSMVLMLVHPLLGVAAMIVASTAASVSQQLGRFGELNNDLPFEILWTVAFISVFLAIALVATRTGRMLDETREETYRKAAGVAAAASRQMEKVRFDAIVHDRVIASLLAVGPGRPDAHLAGQAASALEELARVPDPAADHLDMSRDEVIRRIRSAAGEISERTDVEILGRADLDPDEIGTSAARSDGPEAGFPAQVVDAVVEAMSEALRNVVRHAGADAESAVIVQLTADALSMAVVDDGAGFDPDAVAPGRIGIAVSIRERMAQLPGGSARMTSRVGRGTTVQIAWERP